MALLTCWSLFLIYSLIRVPIPGINEPHYLGMAKAVWNPSWCQGDLFLESATPHHAFYLLLGGLTQFLTLEQVAVIGRALALLLTAWGWNWLAWSLHMTRSATVCSAGLFLLIQSGGSWSGEWLIGGVESKVFAYGFVLAGWGALFESRWFIGAILLGLATTMHPVVGAWAILAVLTVAAFQWGRDRLKPRPADEPEPYPESLGKLVLCAALWLLAAAPGLYWALPSLRSDSPTNSSIATFIQVSYRLAHHLDPWTFKSSGHWYFAILLGLWGVLSLRGQRSRNERWLGGIAIAAVVFGLVATALSYSPRPWTYPPGNMASLQMQMLKFYPFRMADLMSALMVSLIVSSRLQTLRVPFPALMTAGVALVVGAIALPGADKTPGALSGERRQKWIETLRWIKESTPPDTLLYAANEDFAVKWFAERPEYVNFKDCPQNADGVVEWNNRLLRFSKWATDSMKGDNLITQAELAELNRLTGIRCLIVSRFGPMESAPAFKNGPFAVHLITPPDSPEAPDSPKAATPETATARQ